MLNVAIDPLEPSDQRLRHTIRAWPLFIVSGRTGRRIRRHLCPAWLRQRSTRRCAHFATSGWRSCTLPVSTSACKGLPECWACWQWLWN